MFRRSVVLGLTATLALTTLLPVESPAEASASGRTKAPAVQSTPSVSGSVVPPAVVVDQTTAGQATSPAAPLDLSWPVAGNQTVTFPGSQAARDRAGRGVRMGPSELPVTVTPTEQAAQALAGADVRLEVLSRDQAAAHGLTGPAFRLDTSMSGSSTGDYTFARLADEEGGLAVSAEAPIEVRVGYEAFADTYGGDWSSRLQLVQVNGCDLPSGCMVTPLSSVNDPVTKTVTASIAVPGSTNDAPAPGTRSTPSTDKGSKAAAAPTGGSMLMLAAGASGAAGSFAATSLSPSSSWSAGGSSGDFTWSYAIEAPSGLGGPAPSPIVTYSSGSVDGRTASTNNQPSWVGEGFDLTTGYVERRYVPCSEDMTGGTNTVKTGDLCWSTHNATLVMDGRAGELVRVGSTSTWRLQDDDGTRVELLTGATGNGDNDAEYWKVTTTDGTQFFFGRNKRGAADTANTDSVWTVPVFGNQGGEPCAQATFAASWCQQGWRWNLDHVVDTNANTMTNFYAKETNNYGRNNNTAVSAYNPGGYLLRTEYGQRLGSEHTTTAPYRVVYGVAERCLPSGTITCTPAQLTAANASHWPDTPFDQICTSTTSCSTVRSPAFFTRKRLTTITTQALVAGTYQDVDAWALTQQFKDPGDGTSKSLWLAQIQRTGKATTTAGAAPITLPPVTFTGTQMANRIDGIDNAPPLVKWRVNTITSETGSSTAVVYSLPDCTPTSLPTSAHENTRRCFPGFYTPEGASNPSIHWFHKYVVTQVTQTDSTAQGPSVVNSYTYPGAPAWHYDDSPTTPTKYRTWGQWRGYELVEARTGSTGEPQTKSTTRYMRGMDDDTLPAGARRQVSVTDSQGGVLEDHPRLAGFVRESITYLGDTNTVVSTTLGTPWISAATAGAGTTAAHMVREATSTTRTPLAAGGVRTTQTTTTYDTTYGMATQVDDAGDTTLTTDDLCTRTKYVRNTAAWIVDTVASSETVAKNCAAPVSRPGDVIAETRNSYDGAAYGVAPTAGNVTAVAVIDDSPQAAATGGYATTARTTYDALGRPLTVKDALNRTTSTTYTPTTGGPLTGTTVTNPLGHTVTTTIDPRRGVPVTVLDINNARTDATYDALGRTTAAWMPDRSKAGGATASTTYQYLVRNNAPSAVSTSTLKPNGTYRTSWALFDAMLRPRQTQEPAAGTTGGRMVTETSYDTHGRVVKQAGPYYNSANPSDQLFLADPVQIPAATVTQYDGASRPTAAVFTSDTVEKWRTTTSYGGDRTTTIYPAGQLPTTAVADARGRTTTLLQYRTTNLTGAADTTTYAYTPLGQVASHTDSTKSTTAPISPGNTWTYTYDKRGRQTAKTDPDTGTTISTYDIAGQLLTTTDARGRAVTRSYDATGRPTSTTDTTAGASTLLHSWTYDTLTGGSTTNAKGRVATISTHTPTGVFVQAVTGYDVMGRPTGQSLTVPAAETGLAGTYTTGFTYAPDGSPRTVALPAVPGLSAETVTTSYNAAGQPTALIGAGTPYSLGTAYSPYGQVLQRTLQPVNGNTVWQTTSYDEATQRVESYRVDRSGTTTPDVLAAYAFDPAGNITSITDEPVSGTAASTDRQCFGYDYLRRLTEAWTPGGTCADAKSVAALSGPAPYWNSYGYDLTGNRTSSTERTPTSTTTTTSTFPAAGGVRPHAPTAETAVTTGTGGGTVTRAFGYDDAGNTTTRGPSGDTQTLTWDATGRLAKATAAPGPTAGETSYVTAADGTRLLRREPTAVTLYLGSTEIRRTTSTGSATSTRQYSVAGATVAVRTSSGVSVLSADHHGTANLSVDAATLAITARRTTPYGTPRGTTPTAWPSEKGFVGGTQDDSTGLTQLGHRAYDPSSGRFISPDPLLRLSTPQQWNAYGYGNGNPVLNTDPDGLEPYPQHNQNSADGPEWSGPYGANPHKPETKPRTTTYKTAVAIAAARNLAKGKVCGRCWMPTLRKQWFHGTGSLSGPELRMLVTEADLTAELMLHVEAVARATDVVVNHPIAQIIGVTDVVNCAKGDRGACVMAAATIVIPGIGGLAVKGAVWGVRAVRTARASEHATTTFHTVQSAADAARLRGGGAPWPTAPRSAALGEGVYAWSSASSAAAYQTHMTRLHGVALEVVTFQISNRNLMSLRHLDVDSLADEGNAFLDRYSALFGGKPDHGFEHIARGTQFGTEHFFSKAVYGMLNWS